MAGTCRAWSDEQLETAGVLCLVYGKFIVRTCFLCVECLPLTAFDTCRTSGDKRRRLWRQTD